MKLELKHLSPYLPHNLDTTYLLSDVIKLVTDHPKDETRNKRLTDDNVSFVLSYCKPILRPLSDLKKKIDENEEVTFHDWIGSEYGIDSDGLIPYDTDILPYGVVQYLFEWHFDVLGLIDKGLAIDINTLKDV